MLKNWEDMKEDIRFAFVVGYDKLTQAQITEMEADAEVIMQMFIQDYYKDYIEDTSMLKTSTLFKLHKKEAEIHKLMKLMNKANNLNNFTQLLDYEALYNTKIKEVDNLLSLLTPLENRVYTMRKEGKGTQLYKTEKEGMN